MSALTPNSHPDIPAGTQGLGVPHAVQPSQPGRSASSLPGKSTAVRFDVVEFTSVRRNTDSLVRPPMFRSIQSSTSRALAARSGTTWRRVPAEMPAASALNVSNSACMRINSCESIWNATSILAAISAVTAARPLRNAEKAGRPTPTRSAASPTPSFLGFSAFSRTN